jgi:hypothetical protein
MIKSERKSVAYYSDERPKAFDEFYTDMFIEDTSSGIMPVGGIGRTRNFSVELKPYDQEFEQALINGLVTHEQENSLGEAVCELLRLVTTEVCVFDRAVYEVAYQKDENDTIVGFELAYVKAAQIVSKGKRIYQQLPREVAQRTSHPEVIDFEDSEIIIFQPPAELGPQIRRTRNVLSRLSELDLSSFVLTATRRKIPFQFPVHRAAMELALAENLKNTGWMARGLFQEGKLSYYSVYMHLTFERFKLKLRTAFIEQLNAGITRIAKTMNCSGNLEITGLPTEEEINTAFAKLESGQEAFTQIMEPFLRY